MLRLTSITQSNLRICQMLYHWLIKYIIWDLKQITDICVTCYNFHNESQLVKFVMKDVCHRYVRSVQLWIIATLDNKLEQPLISSTQEEILNKKTYIHYFGRGSFTTLNILFTEWHWFYQNRKTFIWHILYIISYFTSINRYKKPLMNMSIINY